MQDDFDRSLNERGRRSAPAIARWLAEQGHLPDIVLVSGARRTVETWERMAPHLPETAEMQSAPALYLAEPKVILGVLRSQSAPTVMMIGHNPGFALLAGSLARQTPRHTKFSHYPTAACGVFAFDTSRWDDITPGSATVVDFVVPRDLLD